MCPWFACSTPRGERSAPRLNQWRHPERSRSSGGVRDLLLLCFRRRFKLILPIRRKILPSRIRRLNQLYFLATAPTFDFLLSIDRRSRIEKAFVIHETSEIVTARETRNAFPLVLPDARY